MSQAKDGPKRSDGPIGVVIALVAAVAAMALVERLTRPDDRGERTAPVPMPELVVGGWLNTGGGPGPTEEELAGRYVVVDFWATDCGPCLRSLPHLAEFNERWRDRGVEVIGLTAEPEAQVDAIEAVIARTHAMDWPVAYGAGFVHAKLGVTMIPTYVLFSPEGKSVWRGHSVTSLESVLESVY